MNGWNVPLIRRTRSICSYHHSIGRRSNYEINKLLNQLFNENRKKNKNVNRNEEVVAKAMKLYNSIDEDRNHYTINTLCKILFHFKHKQRKHALFIWNDIMRVLHSGLSYSLLINVYSQCDMRKSLNIFESVPANALNIAIINSMMQAHITHHKNDCALRLYGDIHPSVAKDEFCHILALRACRNERYLHKGQHIHRDIGDNNIGIRLKTALIGFYGDLCRIHDARNVFHSVSDECKDIQLINAMMTAYISNNQSDNALRLYDEYNIINLQHHSKSHVLAIRACKQTQNYEKVSQIARNNCDHILIKNALIDFYGTLRDIDSALNVFHSVAINRRDIVSINSMMKAYICSDQHTAALDLYDACADTHQLDVISHVLCIKACIAMSKYDTAQCIHDSVYCEDKDVMRNPNYKSIVVDMYNKSGALDKALDAFDDAYECNNIIVFNAMMNALIDHNECDAALRVFDDITINKNDTCLMLAIKCCLRTGNASKGNEIINGIGVIDALNIHEFDIELINTVIAFHGECADITQSQQLFAVCLRHETIDVCTVAAMMNCFIQNEMYADALNIYFQYSDLSNDISHLLAIKACTKLNDYGKGQMIIDKMKKTNNISLQNALIDFYGKCDSLQSAIDLFNASIHKDTATVCSMMGVYCHHDMNLPCIDLFNALPTAQRDVVSYVIVFKAYTSGTYLYLGQQTHAELKQNMNGNGWMLRDVSLQISLIHFYGKCGMLQLCFDLFDEIKANESHKYCTQIGIWNAMIAASGRNGQMQNVNHIYETLRTETAMKPDKKTFIALLNACSHCGDVDKAHYLWNNHIDGEMRLNSHVMNAFIDCCSRNGYLNQMLEFAVKYKNHMDQIGWISLLSAAKTHNRTDIANKVYHQMESKLI
eukprot:829607_1